MYYYIGIDLGTSACKLLLVGRNRCNHKFGHKGIPAELPAPRLVGAKGRGLVGRGRDRRSGAAARF